MGNFLEQVCKYYNFQTLYLQFENVKFGGPGGSCRLPNFINLCSTFLKFCHEKLNSGSKIIKFVSFHRKGEGDVDSILQDELEKTVPLIEETIPDELLAKNNLSLFNNEGDPQKSWWKPHFWRATVAYPALVAR